MSFFSEDKKNEIKWWIEDHKGKFYAICGVFVVAIFAGIIAIASQFGEEPVIEAPTEDSYEELDVGGFNVEEQIQKENDEENAKQEEAYGIKIDIESRDLENKKPFSYVKDYDYSFIDFNESGNMSVYELYVDNTTLDSSVFSSNTYNLMDKQKNIFYLRCKIEDLPEETRLEWEKRDKRNVLDLFRDSKVNKETAKAWNTHLSEVKISKGFTDKDTEATIGAEKWNEIMDEMYTYFEEYLLGLDNEETGDKGPLSQYLKENPYPKYDRVKVAKSPIYLCDIKARSCGVFTYANLDKYVNLYWNAYCSDAEEIFVNEGDYVGYQTLKAGKLYKLKKQVEFTLECAYPSEDIVVWYLDKDGRSYSIYIPEGNKVWEHHENNGYWKINNLDIDEDVICFGYYTIGKTYKRNFTANMSFDTINEKGEIVVEQKDLAIDEKIKYTRKDKLGENHIVNVSEFYLGDGPFEIPYGVYYIKNDTKENITLVAIDESSNYTLEPGAEVYIDWTIESFNWRINR